jgi:uncharacterized protein
MMAYEGRRANWAKINVPLLTVATWGAIGSRLRGNVEGFMNTATREMWLVTRSSHGTFAALYSDEGLTLQRRGFDFTLKGTGDFSRTQPKIELTIRDANDRTAGRRAGSEWPLAGHSGGNFISTQPHLRSAHLRRARNDGHLPSFQQGHHISDAAAR